MNVLDAEAALQKARDILRQMQARGSVLPAVMNRLARYRDFEATEDPNIVLRGGLQLDRALELKRIQLAEELAKRVDPRSFEEPAHFAMLAYAAASLELALPDTPSGRPDLGWDRFLLGTVHSPEVKADSGLIEESDVSLIYLSSALIDFVIQAAKVVVAATEGRSSSSVTPAPEYVQERLRRDPEPANRLYRTLEAYVFEGAPWAFPEEIVTTPHTLPLGTLVSLAFRWIIAHELGHRAAAMLQNPDLNIGQREEYFADFNATILTIYSAVRLDALPAELGPAGGAFFLACHDILNRARSLASTGEEVPESGDASHPPDETRANQILESIEKTLVLSSGRDHVELSLRPHLDLNAGPNPETRKRVLGYAHSLFAVWSLVRPRLMKDRQRGRKPHPMWT
jgi:hypothetical protein